MEALFFLMSTFGALYALFALLFCACCAMDAARSKGESRFVWFVLGLLFGPLALLALAAYAPKAAVVDAPTKASAPSSRGSVDPHAAYRVNVPQS